MLSPPGRDLSRGDLLQAGALDPRAEGGPDLDHLEDGAVP